MFYFCTKIVFDSHTIRFTNTSSTVGHTVVLNKILNSLRCQKFVKILKMQTLQVRLGKYVHFNSMYN